MTPIIYAHTNFILIHYFHILFILELIFHKLKQGDKSY